MTVQGPVKDGGLVELEMALSRIGGKYTARCSHSIACDFWRIVYKDMSELCRDETADIEITLLVSRVTGQRAMFTIGKNSFTEHLRE